jgi:hypothetical protein
MKIEALKISGRDLNKVVTSLLMLGIVFRVLRGLSTLSMRRDLMLTEFDSMSISLYDYL